MYVTGVGHTSLSSASIRSGEIIIPIKCGTKGRPSPILGSARVHCAHLAREESAHRAAQGWVLMISPLAYAGATAGMGVAAGVGWQAEGERKALEHMGLNPREG